MCSTPKITPKSLAKAAFDPGGFMTKEPDPLEIFGPKATGDVPGVVQDTPIADQKAIEAKAAATGVQARTEMRRRRRRSSLLATGGKGDDSVLPQTLPGAAAGKPSLGG